MNNDLFPKWNVGYKFSSTKSNDRNIVKASKCNENRAKSENKSMLLERWRIIIS